jgi:hypothetical protein
MKPCSSRLLPVLALVVALHGARLLAAPVPSPSEEKPKAEAPAEKIRKILDQPTNLDIADQSLELAVAQLREETKINFVLDRPTIANLGIDPQGTAVQLKVQGVKLRTALRTILGQHNLSYAILGETVLITTEDMAMARQLRQRVTVDLDRAPFNTALKQLARETATNLVVDVRAVKESQAPVTLQLEDVPLETAVRLMAEIAGLKPVRVGNVLFVTTKVIAVEMRSDPDLAPAPRFPGQDPLIIGGGFGGFGGGVGGFIGAPPAVAAPPVPIVVPEKPVEAPPEKPADPGPPRPDKKD